MVDDETATVVLVRNGGVVGIQKIGRGEGGLPSIPVEGKGKEREDAIALARRQLLTGAAAFVLLELAKRHARLRRGLCRATHWKSVWLHVLATEKPLQRDEALMKELLETAVELDHENLLARVAYLSCLGRRGDDLKDQENFASRILEAYDHIFVDLLCQEDDEFRERQAPEKGFEPLQMRMLHSIVAAWLNVHLLREEIPGGAATQQPASNHGDPTEAQLAATSGVRDAWHKARYSVRWMIRRLVDEPRDARMADFMSEMKPAAGYLWQGVRDRADTTDRSLFDELGRPLDEWEKERRELDRLTKDWVVEEVGVLSRECRYDRACWRAERRPATHDDMKKALEDLDEATGIEDLRVWARSDPSFKVFRSPRTDYELRRRFKEIVGDAPPSKFLDLAPFIEHALRLRAYGIQEADHLAKISRWRLALHLGVDSRVVDRWQGIVQLGRVTMNDQGSIDLAILSLLLACGVESREALGKSLKKPDKLYNDMVKAAKDYAVELNWGNLVQKWRAAGIR